MQHTPQSPIIIDPIPDFPDGRTRIKRTDSDTRQRWSRFFRVMIPLTVFAALFLYQPLSDAYVVSSYDNEGVAHLAAKSGMSLRGKALFYTQDPEIVDANTLHKHCPHEDEETVEFGCYDPNAGKIYLLNMPDQPYSEVMVTTASHEMLHAAWNNLNDTSREAVSSALHELKDTSSDDADIVMITKSLSNYDKDKDLQSNELHSFVGSETHESLTNDFLDDHYGTYFSNRTLTAQASDAYHQGIEEIEASFAKRLKELEKEHAALDTYIAQWITPLEAAMNRSAAYGDYYSYNRNVDAYNNNAEIYETKRKAYNKLSDAYNADIERYNTIYGALQPDKELKSAPTK